MKITDRDISKEKLDNIYEDFFEVKGYHHIGYRKDL